MVTLARCCANATATTSSTIPYRRLKRARPGVQQQQEEQDASRGSGEGEEEEDEGRVAEERLELRSSFRKSCSVRSNPDDTVVLKVAMVGDSEAGKTCFVRKYMNSDHSDEYVATRGIVLKEKSLRIINAKIVFSVWELGGDKQFQGLLPRVCEGAAALIFMFDLTKRSTLKSVKDWYVRTRRLNTCAIPVIVGTKYDQFINFPQDIQLAITKQAMFYAETMSAALFFSSTTHNINVNKVFKVIVARVFDLRCNISKNHNIGEPIVSY